MTEHLRILRRVGWVLVGVGLLDIGVMAYCIVNNISYSSSLNIFAVIGGILLLRGNLGAVRAITWFSAFMFSGLLLSFLFVFPWLQPIDYSLLMLREHPVVTLGSILLAMASLGMLFWVYTQLRLPAVVTARVAAGHARGAPKSAFLAGAATALVLAVTLQLTLDGNAAQEAKRLAAKQYGSGYKYFVSSINWSGRHVSARVTAYKEDKTKRIAVQWDR